MRIPEKLGKSTKTELKRYVKALRRAVKAECLRCMNTDRLKKTLDCDGLDLAKGNCPLYDYRPFWANRGKGKGK